VLGGNTSTALPSSSVNDAPFLAGGNVVEAPSRHRGRDTAVLTRQGDGIHVIDVSTYGIVFCTGWLC
jgi:hypothetical protein